MDTLDSRLADMIENIDAVTKDPDLTKSRTIILDYSHLNLETLRYPKEINLLTHLDLSNNNLQNIPSLKFSNIEIFDCGSNKLTQLPPLPSTIIEINCVDNIISSLDPILPLCPRLKRIDCSFNKLKSIPKFTMIDTIVFSNNAITSISDLPTVTTIICNENGLETVSNLPRLKVLDACYNKLKSITDLPSLEELYCSNNLLEQIDQIPKVVWIDCYKNHLKLIKYFPQLKEIIFDYNESLVIDNRYKIVHIHKSEVRQLMHLTMG